VTGRSGRCIVALLLAVAGLAGCAGGAPANAARDAWLGVYRGSFGTAHTDDPADDINYQPCDPAAERCLGGAEPLVDVLLELRRDADGRMGLAFFRSAEDRERNRPLDLLGPGCGTTIAPLAGWSRDRRTGHDLATFPLAAGNRLCLNKLRPTSGHELRVTVSVDAETGEAVAQVIADREVRSANYLYTIEDGKRRRVRIDLDNTLDTATDTRYRVCIEDDLGDFTRCVMTDRELKRFVLPVPLPDGAALSYTWWYELTPRLKRTRGLYELEQYVGRFVRQQ
jgi:hypothetical protein